MRYSEYAEKQVIQLLQPDFSFDISDRITVVCDLDQFKASEDKSVWLQKKERAPKYYEVYWDDEWIIDFADDVQPQIVYALFWQGFKKKYEAGRIHLNKFLTDLEKEQDITYLIEKQKKQEQAKDAMAGAFEVAADNKLLKNPEETQIAKEIATEIEKETGET